MEYGILETQSMSQWFPEQILTVSPHWIQLTPQVKVWTRLILNQFLNVSIQK